LISEYEKSIHITDYIDFSLPVLSSGELGFLTLFSRFEALTNHKWYPNKEIDKAQNLIIFIDEGDLYFHPKWQAKFIEFINVLLPKIFSDKKIQLIITSHSQFIASDLPSENLLFMKRSEKDFCELDEGLDRTFAANIHDLLSSAFFLEGAHIGSFAKSVIYSVLDELALVNKPSKYSSEELKLIINSIGDDWMRNQLLAKYDLYIFKSQL
jgi:predicted ATP-binding protein involved in virulence